MRESAYVGFLTLTSRTDYYVAVWHCIIVSYDDNLQIVLLGRSSTIK
jgi:hypothetical protein